MASEDARAAYVKLIMELDPAWSLQPADADVDAAALLSERKQSWVVFSSLQDAGCCATPPPSPPTPPHPGPISFLLCAAATPTAAARRASGKATLASKTSPDFWPHACAAALLLQATWTSSAQCWRRALTSTHATKISKQCRSPPLQPSASAPFRHVTRRLHVACDRGHLQLAQLLLSNAADPNAVEANGSSALHLAAAVENFDAVQLLLHAGASSSAAPASFPPPHFSVQAPGRTPSITTVGEQRHPHALRSAPSIWNRC
jgi:hypothetical protein